MKQKGNEKTADKAENLSRKVMHDRKYHLIKNLYLTPIIINDKDLNVLCSDSGHKAPF